MTPKKIFILDGIGGLLTTLSFLAIILFFSSYFGLPNKILAVFASFGAVYGIFSFSVAFKAKKWISFLKTIVIANLMYGAITITTLLLYKELITKIELTYFCVEILVLSILIWLELDMVNKTKN
ncbi:MAG: hypothetical protein AB8B74_14500 [Crocinitomicaceae bacterium]